MHYKNLAWIDKNIFHLTKTFYLKCLDFITRSFA